MTGSRERLIAFVLFQKGEDQMMPKALWTGREHPDWNGGLVGKSGTREKIPNDQLCTPLTGLRFHDYWLRRNIIMTPAVSLSFLGSHTSISKLPPWPLNHQPRLKVGRPFRGFVSTFPTPSA